MSAPTTRRNSRATSRTLHIPIYSGVGRGVISHAHLTKWHKNLAVTNLFRNFAHVSGFCGRCGFKHNRAATVVFTSVVAFF